MGAPTVRRQGHANTSTEHGQRTGAGSVCGSPALNLLGTEDGRSGQRILRQLELFVHILLECALLATRLLAVVTDAHSTDARSASLLDVRSASLLHA